METAFLPALVNLGGGFVMAAALWILHREAIKSFKEELHQERQLFDKNITLERQMCHEDHTQMMGVLLKVQEDVEDLKEGRDK